MLHIHLHKPTRDARSANYDDWSPEARAAASAARSKESVQARSDFKEHGHLSSYESQLARGEARKPLPWTPEVESILKARQPEGVKRSQLVVHLEAAGHSRAEALEHANRLLSGARDEYIGFAKLEKKLAGQPGVTDPKALAAWIGIKKYGAAGMAAKAAAGRSR